LATAAISHAAEGDAPSSTANEAGPLVDTATAVAWSWRLTLLGIAVRVIRYLCVFPIWQDEQLLTLNLIDRDYAGLLGRLEMFQVAPVGFVLLEKFFVETFGLNEYSLRAVALISSIVGLLAFRGLAARLLRGPALVLAVGILAISFFPVRHAAEFKPYAGDLCFSALLLLGAVDWFREPTRPRRWFFLTAIAILALPFSFPAVFVIGGVSLTMLPTIWRARGSWKLVAAYTIFNVATAATFFALLRLNIDDQFAGATQTNFMYDYWDGGFPPSWTQPWQWPLWLAEVHAGEGLAYPIGTKRFGSILTAVLAIVGFVTLRRRGETLLPRLTLGILALALVAACLGRYPYGHGERLQQYWAPFVVLLIGAGGATAIEGLRSAVARRRTFHGTIGVFVTLAAVLVVHAHLRPYKHRWDREHQLFSRWFWRFASEGAPQLCITDDLGWRLYHKDEQKSYIVNREIYRHGPAARARHDWNVLPAGSPIECVTFALAGRERDDDQFAAWLSTMQQHYWLVDERVYPIMIDDKPGKAGAYYVWRFEPISPDARPDVVVKGNQPTGDGAIATTPKRSTRPPIEQAKRPLDRDRAVVPVSR
jgi:hypothetical protein